jgi:exodeoxyribonuclease VII large subunit
MVDLGRRVRGELRHREEQCRNGCLRLQAVRPSRQIARRAEGVAASAVRLRTATGARLRALRDRLARAEARLRLLSPEQVLDRGYSLTTDAATGRLLRVASEIVPGQRLRTRLQRGTVESIAEASQESA